MLLDAVLAETERELRQRDEDMERVLRSWAERQPADD
jgi:hypothetical protein